MFNTLAGVTFHLIKDSQIGMQDNILQFYLLSLLNQNLSTYLANRIEQNQKQPIRVWGGFFVIFNSLSNSFFYYFLRAERI